MRFFGSIQHETTLLAPCCSALLQTVHAAEEKPPIHFFRRQIRGIYNRSACVASSSRQAKMREDVDGNFTRQITTLGLLLATTSKGMRACISSAHLNAGHDLVYCYRFDENRGQGYLLEGHTRRPFDFLFVDLPVLRYQYKASTKQLGAASNVQVFHHSTTQAANVLSPTVRRPVPHHRGLFSASTKSPTATAKADTWHCTDGAIKP